MPGVDVTKVQELVSQVDRLKRSIETAGDDGRARLRDIKLDDIWAAAQVQAGKVDPNAWGQLAPDKQAAAVSRLAQARDALRLVEEGDGPADDKSIMSGNYASNGALWVVVLYGAVLVSVLLAFIVLNWNKATGTDYAPRLTVAVAAIERLDSANAHLAAAPNDSTLKREVAAAETSAGRASVQALRSMATGGVTESFVLLVVTMLGALGGALHVVGSAVVYIGNRQFKRSWLTYYYALPFVGAALAPMVYMLLRVGILTPTGIGGDGSHIANLNLIGIYAFAGMTGMFARTAIDKLSEVFSTIFRIQTPSKDPVGQEKPPGRT